MKMEVGLFEKIRNMRNVQLLIGLFSGIIFGFLLQRGGLAWFDTIIGQLLFEDWRVVKVMLTSIIVGTVGIHLMLSLKMIRIHPKPGSIGSTIIGALIFGAGFAILGYCPGIVFVSAGQGSLDALLVGITGILAGSGIFIIIYPFLEKRILSKGRFSSLTFPELFKVSHWVVVIPLVIILSMFLYLIEKKFQ